MIFNDIQQYLPDPRDFHPVPISMIELRDYIERVFEPHGFVCDEVTEENIYTKPDGSAIVSFLISRQGLDTIPFVPYNLTCWIEIYNYNHEPKLTYWFSEPFIFDCNTEPLDTTYEYAIMKTDNRDTRLKLDKSDVYSVLKAYMEASVDLTKFFDDSGFYNADLVSLVWDPINKRYYVTYNGYLIEDYYAELINKNY